MLPHEIERESFRIIRTELGPHPFSEEQLEVVVRVIHATADFDFGRVLRFHPQAVSQGIAALRRGCAVVTDVQMVQVGITADLLTRLGGRTICDIKDSTVAETARQLGLTRACVSMRQNARYLHNGIAAIGNAPTALLEVIRLVRQEGIRPALIVGVPVGFVKAAEAKDELLTLDVPYITAVGRKGGSSVAVATINALLRLAAANG